MKHILGSAIILAGTVGLIGAAMQSTSSTKQVKQPVVRISKGRFSPEKFAEVKRLIDESAIPLVPAIRQLRGLLYYHAAVDAATNTVVNEQAAKQMSMLAPMLAQRPILEGAGVKFDEIANYEPAWKIETTWAFGAK